MQAEFTLLGVLRPLSAVWREAVGSEATATLIQKAEGEWAHLGNVNPFQCVPSSGCSQAWGAGAGPREEAFPGWTLTFRPSSCDHGPSTPSLSAHI